MAPAPLRDLVTARVRRGTCTKPPDAHQGPADLLFRSPLSIKPHQSASLLRRRAIYLLGFDTRSARMTGPVAHRAAARRERCWAHRSRSVLDGCAILGHRTRLRWRSRPVAGSCRHVLALTGWSRRISITGLTGWARSATSRSMTNSWAVSTHAESSGVLLLRHLLERLRPGSGHAELNVHTVWTLLLAPSRAAQRACRSENSRCRHGPRAGWWHVGVRDPKSSRSTVFEWLSSPCSLRRSRVPSQVGRRCSPSGTTRRKPVRATSRTPPGATSTSAAPK